MARIACAFIARYEVALRARAEPDLLRRPLAIVDLATKPARLAAVTAAAEALGVRAGDLATSARARVPELDFLAPDPEARWASEREILSALAGHAPLLDWNARGGFFLGLEGMERLFESQHLDERAFAEGVRRSLAELGLTARVAVADGPFVAWVAAQNLRGAETVGVVAPGDDRALLERIPLQALELSEPAQVLLRLLGIRSAGALASLPPGSLGRRLGREGVELERLCHGERPYAWPSSDRAPAPPESATMELDAPTEELEMILFSFKALLDRVLKGLAHQHRALAELQVSVCVFPARTTVVHTITPPRPTLDARGMMTLIRLWLERRPFDGPVVGLGALAAKTGVATARQLGLFDARSEQEADALERASARLTAAFGAAAVVRPVLGDSFRPEHRLRWIPFAAAAKPANSTGLPLATGASQSPPAARWQLSLSPLVLRTLDPPEPIWWEVGMPSLRRAGHPAARVLRVDGPHRLASEWWAAPFDRSYYWLLLEGGALWWVYRDEREGRGYLYAVAD